MDREIYEYIITEESNYKTVRVPLTNSKDWNMSEHIERCTNVANGWFHGGKNDGLRMYTDIATPIIDVAFRSEGFDVKDIVPFVNNIQNAYKSFLVKKYHPKWARKNELDTLIDEVVESSIIYDLALLKDVNGVRPELVPLPQIAFCDQTDVLSGPICIKHYYTIADLLKKKGDWFENEIDLAILSATAEKSVPTANDQKVKTPGKYIEVYELHGEMPESWLKDGGSKYKYVPQLQVVCLYTGKDGKKEGITLYKGKNKPINDVFKALKIDSIRSHGRACGRSVVERLFDPQTWVNYSGLKLKEMLDSAISVFQTESEKFGNQKLDKLPYNTILKHEPGKPITRVEGTLQNLPAFSNLQLKMESTARVLGSASDPQLGLNPVSGTPLGTTQTVVQQGQGIHEYRQGKIATFFADVLYRDWILKYLVEDMNKGQNFSEELTLDELQEISSIIAKNKAEEEIKQKILKGEVVDESTRESLIKLHTDNFKANGNRGFFEIIAGELKDIPLEVMVNVRGKQKDMARDADKLTNLVKFMIENVDRVQAVPGVSKVINEMLENSGMSAIDFSQMLNTPKKAPQEASSPLQPPEGLINNKQEQLSLA